MNNTWIHARRRRRESVDFSRKMPMAQLVINLNRLDCTHAHGDFQTINLSSNLFIDSLSYTHIYCYVTCAKNKIIIVRSVMIICK